MGVRRGAVLTTPINALSGGLAGLPELFQQLRHLCHAVGCRSDEQDPVPDLSGGAPDVRLMGIEDHAPGALCGLGGVRIRRPADADLNHVDIAWQQVGVHVDHATTLAYDAVSSVELNLMLVDESVSE